MYVPCRLGLQHKQRQGFHTEAGVPSAVQQTDLLMQTSKAAK